MTPGWILFCCAQLFWLGIGIYIGACWSSYTHKAKHRGMYAYASPRRPDRWPHTNRPAFDVRPGFERHAS